MYTFFTILLTFFLYGYYIISKTNDKDNLTFKEIAEMIFGDYPSIEGKWYYKLGWAVIKILSYLKKILLTYLTLWKVHFL